MTRDGEKTLPPKTAQGCTRRSNLAENVRVWLHNWKMVCAQSIRSAKSPRK